MGTDGICIREKKEIHVSDAVGAKRKYGMKLTKMQSEHKKTHQNEPGTWIAFPC